MTDANVVQSPPESSPPPATGSIEPSPRDKGPRGERFLNGFLAALVSIYSILTAVVLLTGSRAQGLYADNAFLAQAYLNDASELSMEAHFAMFHDLNGIEEMEIHILLDSDPAIVEHLYEQVSGEAQASIERSGMLDEIYVEEMLAAHNEERELATSAFENAIAWSEQGSTYDTLATVLAVGLAFAAWASLMDRAGWVRWLFAIVAALVLVAGLVFLGVHLLTSEPLEEYVAQVEYALVALPGCAIP